MQPHLPTPPHDGLGWLSAGPGGAGPPSGFESRGSWLGVCPALPACARQPAAATLVVAETCRRQGGSCASALDKCERAGRFTPQPPLRRRAPRDDVLATQGGEGPSRPAISPADSVRAFDGPRVLGAGALLPPVPMGVPLFVLTLSAGLGSLHAFCTPCACARVQPTRQVDQLENAPQPAR